MKTPCDCGCCEGVAIATPEPLTNRPGLPALQYRVGTHATFLESMLAALTTMEVPLPTTTKTIKPLAWVQPNGRPPLLALMTRSTSDPSIALLDTWATVADVLTFYQERLANEGYLRTATSRRSVVELTRLIGHRVRPGVAASVHLAFTVDDGFSGVLPAGTRAQSIPASGELPQFFETANDLTVREEWNAIAARRTRPQAITKDNATWIETIYFAGIATKLKPHDPILIVWGQDTTTSPPEQAFRRVAKVEPEAAEGRTRVTLELNYDALKAGLTYLRALFVELQKPFGAVSPPVSVLPTPGVLPASVTAQQVATAIDTLRAEAHAQSRDRPDWSVALTAIAARLESLGRAYFPELPITVTAQDPLVTFDDLLRRILQPPTTPPATPEHLATSAADTFADEIDTLPKLVAGKSWKEVYETWRQVMVQPPTSLAVYALRTRAPLYGYNARGDGHEDFELVLDVKQAQQYSLVSIESGGAKFVPKTPQVLQHGDVLTLSDGSVARVDLSGPLRIDVERRPFSLTVTRTTNPAVWTAAVTSGLPDPTSVTVEVNPAKTHIVVSGAFDGTHLPQENHHRLSLDAVYPRITAGCWIAVDAPRWAGNPRAFIVEAVSEVVRIEYGLTAQTTTLQLKDPIAAKWIDSGDPFSTVRKTIVYAESEPLPLADEPFLDDVAGGAVEVDGLFTRLDPGRWLIVSGERSDVAAEAGVHTAELVMLARVAQAVQKTFDATTGTFPDLPGDTLHSTFQLATPLSYRYKRDTVVVHANVAKATHGQTVTETLGSGDAARRFQRFPLRQRPLTHVAAATPSGTESTLVTRVDEVAWQEVDSLADREPNERVYVTEVDDDDAVTVVFGNGSHGALLPTGTDNVSAQYRYGIGRAGNVGAERISQLASRPPGAKAVINPLRASGGADRDDRDQARANGPVGVLALDHLVSERDYADFARSFAGIGKAVAARITDGRRRVVHVTIAGAGDIPIDPTSDLHRALTLALREHGDPNMPIEVAARVLKRLVIAARVRIDPRHRWEVVARAVRVALLDTFGFDRRAIGQSAFHSEALAAIQPVPGVVAVDLVTFDALPTGPQIDLRQLAQLAKRLTLRTHVAAECARPSPVGILPAELAILTPDFPDAIMLTEITP